MYLLEIASFKSLLEIPCREKLANIVFIKKLLYDRKNSIATIDLLYTITLASRRSALQE